ncbi:DUF1573 domain-containing protein [uncultured Cytophaga sp.]|uniref:DUF1573 domain-containing protein n=1 Tax=uncultured Cytophaga sp. TaxID=160238 RepID=UPI00260CB0F4|nr:DUF1573 domain-containing protein [uncultured Cytophaga sp.]
MFRIYLILAFVFTSVFYSNAQADVKFKELAHDFGHVQAGTDTLWYGFSFTNTGNEPLQINDVKTSCDCTLAEWPKNAIQPGRTAIIRGGFKIVDKSGSFQKNIIIITNTSPATTILSIKGEIIEDGNTSQ